MVYCFPSHKYKSDTTIKEKNNSPMPKLMVHVLNSCDNVIARWVLLNFRQRTSLVCAKKFKQSTPVIMVMENLGLMETVTC